MVDATLIAYPNLLAKTQDLGEGQCLGKQFKTVLMISISPSASQGRSPGSLNKRGNYSLETFQI